MTRTRTCLAVAAAAFTIVAPDGAAADWAGFTDKSDELNTDSFAFTGSLPEQVNSNENYYDGDFADFDGDGITDRSLGARYGLLMNTGEGLFVPYAGYTGYLLRGMAGASGWGEDGFQWADVDNDGDYDNFSGGNGEPLTLQVNRAGRFSTAWQLSRSALNIVNTDVEGDGDVDMAVAHAFCANSSCGGPVMFSLLINDGAGNMTEESAARGLGYTNTDYIVGVVSGDVDSDGDYDLVIQHGGADAVEVAFNDGTGNYTVQATPLDTVCSGFGQAFNLGDIDDDGDLDIVMGLCTEQTGSNPDVAHQIGLNDGNGSFTDGSDQFDDSGYTDWPLTGGNSTLIDLDFDGDLDYVALRTDNDVLGFGNHHLQVYINDGAGNFAYDEDGSHILESQGSALGADTDVTDLDGDGTLDVWVGIGGDRVHIMINEQEAEDGEPADVPRNVQVVDASQDEVRVSWEAPPFASNARYYKVYRATTPGLHDRDRELVKYVGQRHQDEAFADPITRHTTTASLGDPQVEINGDTIEFIDTDVEPGVTYQYAVAHVGPENTESRQSPEVFATVPGGGVDDGAGPDIRVITPTDQDWWYHPRVVAHFADGGGVDPDTIRVSFDADLGGGGGRAAGTDVSDLAYRKDGGVIIIPLEPPLSLPDTTLVTMTVEASDMDGNTSSVDQQFFVSPVASTLPTADLSASATMGAAPVTIDFDASGSGDADGKLLRWEWYFGDATTAVGRTVSHEFAFGGTYEVKLIVRDNDGGVAVATETIEVSGDPAPCTLGEIQDCYSGPGGTEGVAMCVAGTQQCTPSGWGECVGEVLPEDEICDDEIDNDCDGDIDMADPSCGGPGDETGGAETGVGGEGSGGVTASAGDAGTAGDTDTDGEGGANDGEGGCGCRSIPPPAGAAFLLLGLAALRRRE